MSDETRHIDVAERFAFGDNWAQFLSLVDEARVAEAVESLRQMLGDADLTGRRFLDAGSGSGLFSLAASRLGARVVSFDFDPQSVACTMQLRRRFADETADWLVTQGSVLDAEFLDGLGMFDVVYSWGVLHHTGAMWDACGNIATRVEPGGRLFISIYNDQGVASLVWRRVKRRYNVSTGLGRWLTLHAVDLYFRLRSMAGRTGLAEDRPNRGMDRRYDMIDWVGGYPFEVAGPGEVFEFFHRVGFALDRMRTTSGIGCNEFVFTRVS